MHQGTKSAVNLSCRKGKVPEEAGFVLASVRTTRCSVHMMYKQRNSFILALRRICTSEGSVEAKTTLALQGCIFFRNSPPPGGGKRIKGR